MDVNKLRPVLFLFLSLSACTSATVLSSVNQDIKISAYELLYVDDPALAGCLVRALKDKPKIQVWYPGRNGDMDKPKFDFRYEIHTRWQDTSKNIGELKGYTRLLEDPYYRKVFVHYGEGGAFACSSSCLGLAWIPLEKTLDATISNSELMENGGSGLTVSIKAEGKIVLLGLLLPIPVYVPFLKTAACNAAAQEIVNHIDIINSTETTEIAG